MKKEPIRIAQVVGKMVGGGVEAVIMNYYRNIDKNKVQFDFIVDADSTLIPREEIESMGGRIIIVPPYQKVFKYIKELKKIFKANNYKIVHSHINTLSVFPLFAAFLAGVPVRIAHSHSTAGKGETKRNIIKYCLRPFIKLFATDYFACGNYAGQWLFGKKTFNSGKVIVLNNAIDVEKFIFNKDTRSKIRKDLKIEDKFVIGHVGRFMMQKNHEFIIDIFNEVLKRDKNSILVLVGVGDLKEEIEEKVKELKLTKKVKFLGNRNDVNQLMQGFDLFLLPSLYEGLPVVGVESQAAGLPCLYSDAMTKDVKVISTTEFMSLNQTAEEWANKIIEMKSIKRKNTKKEIISNNFEIKTEAKKLLSYYLNF